MNNGLSNETFRLALRLNLVGFWSTIHPPVGMVLNEALATVRRTPCEKLRGRVLEALWRVAEQSPSHVERTAAALRLADYFYTTEAFTMSTDDELLLQDLLDLPLSEFQKLIELAKKLKQEEANGATDSSKPH